MLDFYQIRSPLSQITEKKMEEYIKSVSAELGEELNRVPLETYINDDFALLYVASGGSEGYFIEVFDRLKDKPCYILTSGDSNSLAASMEILSYLRQHGAKGEILHGGVEYIAGRIKTLRNAQLAKAKLKGKNFGTIGKPSSWLISSRVDAAAVKEKLGLNFIEIPIEELIEESKKESFEPNVYTEQLLAKNYDKAEVTKALGVYGAVKRLCRKYELSAVTVRCFDLLDTVGTTGCLALAILNSEGIYAGCEGDAPSLLSMMVLGTVTGKDCFLCNPSRLNAEDGTALFAHCTLPITMPESYELNTHFESGIGVAIQGTFTGGDCTIFKCAGDLSRFHAQEGEIVETPFSYMLCRTQIKVKVDDFSYFLTEPIGNHHIICRGKYAQAMEDFFSIL